MHKSHRPVPRAPSRPCAEPAAPRRTPRRRAALLDLAAEPAHLPLFVRIARAFVTAIAAGRLAPGARIGGSRELASQLGVHRNTVLAAFRELSAEGYLVAEHGRGTFVADALPAVRRDVAAEAAARSMPAQPAFPFAGADFPTPTSAAPPGALRLFGGMPDVELVPRAAYARAYRRALMAPRAEALLYGEAQGEPHLRTSLAAYLRRERGLAVGPEDILLTRGSQMAFYLLGQVLVGPGDVVAVEALGYPPVRRALAARGARIVPVPLDAEGLCVEALRALCARAPVRAVVVTPHHQYPSTVTMSAARRLALLGLARAHGFAVIEDDYDHEFHYEGRPVLPLASRDLGAVLYIGTLSKVLAPALRVGFLVAPRPVLAAATALRFDIDRQGDRVGERALAELLDDGEVERHLLRARHVYAARRDHAVAQLQRRLGEVLAFDVPRGGMALWCAVQAPWCANALTAAGAARGVYMQAGDAFALGGPTQHVRVGFGGLDEPAFARAATLLAGVARATRGTATKSAGHL